MNWCFPAHLDHIHIVYAVLVYYNRRKQIMQMYGSNGIRPAVPDRWWRTTKCSWSNFRAIRIWFELPATSWRCYRKSREPVCDSESRVRMFTRLQKLVGHAQNLFKMVYILSTVCKLQSKSENVSQHSTTFDKYFQNYICTITTTSGMDILL